MKVYVKIPLYLEIEVKEGTNRQEVVSAGKSQFEAQISTLVNRLKFDDADHAALYKVLATPVRLRLLTQQQFQRQLGASTSPSSLKE